MKDLFLKTLIAELANAIAKNGSECEKTPEAVFENLPTLYEEIYEEEFGQKTGSVKKFLPKRYKEMVMRLISPMSAIVSKTYFFEDHVRVDSSLFYDRTDTQPIATASGYIYFYKLKDVEPEMVKSVAESAARGIAESRCLEKFGIGSWFDRGFQPEECPEKFLNEIDKGNDFAPETVSPTPVAENTPAPATTSTKPKKAKKEAPVEENPEEPQPQEVETKETPTDEELEKALAMPAEVGVAKSREWTLGETLENSPMNLRWMYAQKDISEEGKNALKVIARCNEKIAKSFEEYNLEF